MISLYASIKLSELLKNIVKWDVCELSYMIWFISKNPFNPKTYLIELSPKNNAFFESRKKIRPEEMITLWEHLKLGELFKVNNGRHLIWIITEQ